MNSACLALDKTSRRRHDNDLEVQPQRPMLNVVEVELDALGQVRVTPPAVYLRPPGDTALYHVLFHVAREPVLELFDEVGPFGTRSDDGHLTFQYIDELGQLIQAGTTQEATEARSTRIALGCPVRP